jgi:hypothetical protein
VTRATLSRLVVLGLSTSLWPSAASASLGGSVSSVETDRVQMKSALVRIARSDAYTVHEIQSPTGITIREYYGPNGVVFGVSWDGEFAPDLRQLLGGYFNQYQNAVQIARRVRKARSRLDINDTGLIVRATGHNRSFSGIAYAPNLVPPSVSPNVVR